MSKYSYLRSRLLKSANEASSLTRPSANLKNEINPTNRRPDAIGPPDPVSNLRPVNFAKNDDETSLERRYREARESTQAWNQNFWTKHNCNFVNERKEFRKGVMEETGESSVTADEMSVFYKRFLDKNWRTHFEYNVSWYKRNIKILVLEIKVRLSKIKFK